MPTSRAYGALPNVPRIFRTRTALCRAPRWRTAPARPAVIQTDDEQSRDATNTHACDGDRAAQMLHAPQTSFPRVIAMVEYVR
jgi:hypothetical protein